MKGKAPFRSQWFDNAFWLLLGTGSALIVWATYYPGDSTSIERGESIGFALCVLAWSLIAFLAHRLVTDTSLDWRRRDWWLDGFPVVLACWVFLSGWVNAGVFASTLPMIGGDLRSAMNESWWWLAAACYFVMIRRLVTLPNASFAMTGLLIACGILLAVHTLHQELVSLPQTMREFLSDPDRHFAQLGIDAPEGSAARMIFENRLRDGGPTATFALANSLAGPLAMIAAACVSALFQMRDSLRLHWRLFAFTLVAFLVLISALAMTGSRSGVLSLALAGLYLVVHAIAKGRFRLDRKVPLAIGGVLVLAVGFVLLAGDQTSWAQAPATIQLRLQYWASTLAMVGDHPWFGIGPGNFQLTYQAYRDARAHELIAEPHNFWMETLACGGWVAAILLSCWLGWIAVLACRRDEVEASEPSRVVGSRLSPAMIAVPIGAFVGLMLVWYTGVVEGVLPDFDAHLFAIPLAIVFLVGWFGLSRPTLPNTQALPNAQALPNTHALTNASWRSIGLIAFSTGLVHLCFSGGWTIPGVSLVLLTFLAIAVPTRIETAEPGSLRFTWQWALSVAASVALIVAMWTTGVRPIAASAQAMDQAEMALSRNRSAMTEKILRRSLVADPLAIDQAIWLASIENRRRVAGLLAGSVTAGSPTSDAVFADAVARIGNDPSKLIVIAQYRLHQYQAGGEVEDLAAAAKLLSRIIELSPTHQSYFAQAAEIAREQSRRQLTPLGDPVLLAERATFLSEAGGVITRVLDLQLILPASQLAPAATLIRGPVRKSASEVLKPILANANRNLEDDR